MSENYLIYADTQDTGAYRENVSDTGTNLSLKTNTTLSVSGSLKCNDVEYGGNVYKPAAGAGGLTGTGERTDYLVLEAGEGTRNGTGGAQGDASSSGDYGSTWTSRHAFNGLFGAGETGWHSHTMISGGGHPLYNPPSSTPGTALWLAFQFPHLMRISAFQIRSRNGYGNSRLPMNFNLEAYATVGDGGTGSWETIQSYYAAPSSYTVVSNQGHQMFFVNPSNIKSRTNYRILIASTTETYASTGQGPYGYVNIGEMSYYSGEYPEDDQGVASSSGYWGNASPLSAFNNTYGQNYWAASDSDGSSNHSPPAPTVANPHWIQFKFTTASGGARTISMYKIWIRSFHYGGQSDIYSPKDWKFQGSNVSSPSAADGADWDDLDTRTGIDKDYWQTTSASAGEVPPGILYGKAFYIATDKVGSYTYYRLIVTAIYHSSRLQIAQLALYTSTGSENSGFVSSPTLDTNGTVGNTSCTFHGGNVGIGIVNPQAPLHVGTELLQTNMTRSGAVSYIGPPTAGTATGSDTWRTNANTPGSAMFDSRIICESNIYAVSSLNFSDLRIKKDIVDVTDTEALDKLRLLKPKKYKYVDTALRGESEVYGFIAQEVATVIPNAVTTNTNAVPDIYKIGSVGTDKRTITMSVDTTIAQGDTLRLLDTTNATITVRVTEVVDARNFKINTDIAGYNTSGTNGDSIFVYGRIVEDFNNLNKDAIWTVATAALQQLDRENTIADSKIQDIETDLAAIKTHLNL